MKKTFLLWCVAVTMIQLLAGCNCVNRSPCSDSACKSSPGLLQTWLCMSKKDAAKCESKTQTTSKDAGTPTNAENSDAKDEKWLPRIPLKKTSKNASTKEPPREEIATANGTGATSSKELISVALPDVNKLPPIQTTGAVVIRSDEASIKAETSGSGKDKASPINLKSVHIKYGASANYTVLVGRVQEFRKTLRLRYAAVEQEDAHGGSVMLEGGAELDSIRDGQHVRVRGALIPAEDRLSSARFRVDAVEPLD